MNALVTALTGDLWPWLTLVLLAVLTMLAYDDYRRGGRLPRFVGIVALTLWLGLLWATLVGLYRLVAL
jgi:hypothetical protein